MELGVANASVKKQYKIFVPADKLKVLGQCSNKHGLFYVICHLTLLVCTASISVVALNSNHYVLGSLFILLYGVFFSFLGWAGLSHELSHGTVFKTRWGNEFLLKVVSFFLWNNRVYFKYSHALHHKYTLNTEKDYEVRLPIMLNLKTLLFGCFTGLFDFYRIFTITVKNSLNKVEGPLAATVFSQGGTKRKELVHNARIILLGHVSMMVAFFYFEAYMLIVFLSFGNFISPSLSKVFGFSQHMGMQSNVDDMRLSTRTVILPGFFSFLYWNMNYHLEHHMFPTIPFYQLPNLHKEIVYDSPQPVTGLFNVLKLVLTKNPRS